MMINETKLQIPDEYKEKIQVIYKDKDGYWAYLGYGLCWKEKELHLIYACSEQDFIEEIKQIKACDCDFCEWQDVQRKAERFKRGYSCGIPVPEEHIKQVEMIDRDMDYYLMRMEDGWCCGAEGEHIVEGKNQ